MKSKLIVVLSHLFNHSSVFLLTRELNLHLIVRRRITLFRAQLTVGPLPLKMTHSSRLCHSHWFRVHLRVILLQESRGALDLFVPFAKLQDGYLGLLLAAMREVLEHKTSSNFETNRILLLAKSCINFSLGNCNM